MAIEIPGIEIRLETGTELPPLDKGLISYKHLARWCAAQQNWDKVHYNQDYVRKFAGDKDLHINGAIKAQSLVQFLSNAFAGLGWVWRMDTDFLNIDFAEEHLSVHGVIEDISEIPPYVVVEVAFRIYNSDQNADNTKGNGIVILDPDGRHVTEVDESNLPVSMGIDTSIRNADDKVPNTFRELIGKPLDVIESVIPVDLSRLRLMADAVMNVSPWYYHPEKAADGPFGSVVALPLYPLHGLEAWPDTKPFDIDPEALGREGVTDVGRPNPTRFGMSPVGILNGGNHVQIHSLVRPGETIAAESVLAGAVYRTDHPAGPGIFIDTLNRFQTTSGRELITERQVMGYRVLGA